MKILKNYKNLKYGGPLLGGVISSILLGIILIIITGIVYHFTPIKENFLPILTLIIVILATFWGGKTAASTAGSKGLFWGVSIGILFFIIILIFSIIFKDSLSLNMFFKKLFLCIIGGSLGGIYGISR